MDVAQVVAMLEARLCGRVAACLLDLSGEDVTVRFAHRAELPTATASTYKLPLLICCARRVERGELDWTQPFVVEERFKSWGTGVLRHLAPDLTLTLHDLCALMITVSDNTATDLLVDHLGLDQLNAELAALGLAHTQLVAQHPHLDGPARPPLAAGVSTAAELAQLMAALSRGALTSPETSRRLLHLLGAQQDRSMIPRLLPPDWHYAGKTGSNPDLRADVGLLTGPEGERYALALFAQHPPTTDWSVESPGVLALAELARALVTGAPA